jgi:hypothetical protein
MGRAPPIGSPYQSDDEIFVTEENEESQENEESLITNNKPSFPNQSKIKNVPPVIKSLGEAKRPLFPLL